MCIKYDNNIMNLGIYIINTSLTIDRARA